jgi:hypothetical protein
MNARLNIDTLPPSEVKDSIINPLGSRLSAQSYSGSASTGGKKLKRATTKRGSSLGVGSTRGSQVDMMTIMYDGKEINTIHDLIANFKLDTFEEAKIKRECEQKMQVGDEAIENSMPGPKDVD